MNKPTVNYGLDVRQKSSPSKIIADSMKLTDEYRRMWNGTPYREDDKTLKPNRNDTVSNFSTDTIISQAATQTIVNLNAKGGNWSGFNIDVDGKTLQDAVIWSEILGKPISKRRERRNYAK